MSSTEAHQDAGAERDRLAGLEVDRDAGVALP
jgi:hypothetical protein